MYVYWGPSLAPGESELHHFDRRVVEGRSRIVPGNGLEPIPDSVGIGEARFPAPPDRYYCDPGPPLEFRDCDTMLTHDLAEIRPGNPDRYVYYS